MLSIVMESRLTQVWNVLSYAMHGSDFLRKIFTCLTLYVRINPL